jgi:hypothetical protein
MERDNVKHPEHYTSFPLEVIDMIYLLLSKSPDLTPFEAYCLGNEYKYRFRAGLKSDAQEDIEKAMEYKKIRESK